MEGLTVYKERAAAVTALVGEAIHKRMEGSVKLKKNKGRGLGMACIYCTYI